MKKRFGKEIKVKVALTAIREKMTMAEISSKFGVHSTQIAKWKKQVIEALPRIFSEKSVPVIHKQQQEEMDELYKRIGQLNMENEWLKKKLLF